MNNVMDVSDRSTKATEQRHGLLLPGIDGSNPLGFLAALGVLKALTDWNSNDRVTLMWDRYGGTWSPRLFNHAASASELVAQLDVALKQAHSDIWSLDAKLPFDASRLRLAARAAVNQSRTEMREQVDMIAGIGAESVEDDAGQFGDTQLRMVRSGDSAGNGLLAYARRICEATTRDDLEHALFESWTLMDSECALRWDPSEYHGYALQWVDPSKEKTGSSRGGNRLALMAIAMLPTVPTSSGAKTIGFTEIGRKRTWFSWPIWKKAVSLDVVRSLLSFSDLHEPKPDREKMEQMEIEAIFRCERIMTSKYYRNFTPAQQVT